MSFVDFIKNFKSFNDFLVYLLIKDNYREANTISIYHIHIGSKAEIIDSKSEYARNHECTLFINTLFNNPFKQFSPEFISQLINFLEIKIRNVVILIDIMYSHSPELQGFKDYTDMSLPLINESVVPHCNGSITTINTSIEILQLPFDVDATDISKLSDILINISKLYSILINIMDCTSKVMLEYYANSINNPHHNKISIKRPNCLMPDNSIGCNPIITIIPGSNIDIGEILVRWINPKDDMKLIPELEQIVDCCESSKDTYNFLTEQYKDIVLEELISIVKLWSRLSYTNQQEIDTSLDKLLFKFCDISFTDFISYWKKYPSFRELILSNVDSYYCHNLKVFLDTFVVKYEDSSSHISIVKALQIEAIEIFKKLINYRKDDEYIITNIKGIEDGTTHLLQRKHILDYLQQYNKIHI